MKTTKTTKPYKEAYKGQLRNLCYSYGINRICTQLLYAKLNIDLPPSAILIKFKKLYQRNVTHRRKIRIRAHKNRIKQLIPANILPLP